jgi:hypothetical protein
MKNRHPLVADKRETRSHVGFPVGVDFARADDLFRDYNGI